MRVALFVCLLDSHVMMIGTPEYDKHVTNDH